MYCKLSSFLVVGIKKSGYSSAKLLLNMGATVYIYDDNVSLVNESYVNDLKNLGATLITDPLTAVNYCDILVLSPGVPVDNQIAKTFVENGKRIMGELELGYNFITSPIVAVTGTNGKTSVCSIISHVLTASGVKNELVGNVGVPITSKIENLTSDTVAVTEVSSFQLETTARFLPHIACVLNITSDHLNRHYTLDNYTYVKRKIVTNLRESEFAVLNFDDERVKTFDEYTRANVVWFSTREIVDGAYLDGENLCYNGEIIIKTSELTLSGEHNFSDVLAVICILKILGLTSEEISSGLKTFKGVKHRIEYVTEVDGISFYNDSKATNIDATIKAIKSMQKPTVLILGGYDKGLAYDELMAEIKASNIIKKVVITGASSKRMFDSAIKQGVCEVSVIQNFASAVRVAYRLAEKGWNVLLSPATSSFDEFKSFEERGEKFIEIATTL